MLRLSSRVWQAMVGRAYDALPEEACGLVAGDARSGRVRHFYPCTNVAHSSRVYTVDPGEHLRADRDAERRGLEILGVFHSHTHTDPYPSPTDVAQAPDPSWHYLIVSLRDGEPMLRSFRIREGQIEEEPVALDAG
jgi:proteasome lid subunit RPN8/RPN11